jgi:hypothetical protein
MTSRISEITRKDIVDIIILRQINLYGRLEEIEFLERLWNLDTVPSTDNRFQDAHDDIFQHTINNQDWDPGWVFSYSGFNLMKGDDEIFLKFLCETIHPVVRVDVAECKELSQLYNTYLKHDGFQIIEEKKISGKPVFIGIEASVSPSLNSAKEIFCSIDAGYVTQQINRMETAINSDPGLAIGTAKELVETCCKSILNDCQVSFSNRDSLSKIAKTTIQQLELAPADISDQAKASKIIKSLLGHLAAITQGVAELRNHYGTGHGKLSTNRGLEPRHAKLAVGAASTLAVFLTETYWVKKQT